jgi:hypothetical protein
MVKSFCELFRMPESLVVEIAKEPFSSNTGGLLCVRVRERKVVVINIRKLITIVTLVTLLMVGGSPAHAQLGDFFKKAQKELTGDKLSTDQITRGLKEALSIGTGNAVSKASQKDGYFRNPSIRIPLPANITKVEKILDAAGMGQQVDDFTLSMNRAAEQAAPEAKDLFIDAITQMSFSDAENILNGENNAATLYFKDKTYSRLQEIFQPIVHNSMSTTGVTRNYQEIEEKIDSIPFASSINFDLDRYVTDKALDGLFFLVAEEEKKIRDDPAARVTDLLKDVFGN